VVVSGRNGRAAVDHLALSAPHLPSSQFPSHKSHHSGPSCSFLSLLELFVSLEVASPNET